MHEYITKMATLDIFFYSPSTTHVLNIIVLLALSSIFSVAISSESAFFCVVSSYPPKLPWTLNRLSSLQSKKWSTIFFLD